VYIYTVAKSLGFSFGQTKNKTKPASPAGRQKAIALCADGNKKVSLLPHYA